MKHPYGRRRPGWNISFVQQLSYLFERPALCATGFLSPVMWSSGRYHLCPHNTPRYYYSRVWPVAAAVLRMNRK